MKNLANCTPTEFLTQTNKVRKAVSKWLTDTDIAAIRAKKPELLFAPVTASDEERKAVIAENEKRIKTQGKKNLNEILDAIMEQHPQETLELLALLSFVEPKDVDKHPISEYLGSFAELISDEAVLSFFTSLMRLDQTGILR